jgi:hypothetical protein
MSCDWQNFEQMLLQVAEWEIHVRPHKAKIRQVLL